MMMFIFFCFGLEKPFLQKISRKLSKLLHVTCFNDPNGSLELVLKVAALQLG